MPRLNVRGTSEGKIDTKYPWRGPNTVAGARDDKSDTGQVKLGALRMEWEGNLQGAVRLGHLERPRCETGSPGSTSIR